MLRQVVQPVEALLEVIHAGSDRASRFDTLDLDSMPAPAAEASARRRLSSEPFGGNPPAPRPPSAAPPPAKVSSPRVSAAHIRRLAALAVDLEAQIAGGCDGVAIRRVRQRLIEWIEDLRSVGGSAALADAVEARVRRLSDALAAPSNLAAELKAIADELAQLASRSRSRSRPWRC
jgi:hypothetical protein